MYEYLDQLKYFVNEFALSCYGRMIGALFVKIIYGIAVDSEGLNDEIKNDLKKHIVWGMEHSVLDFDIVPVPW